VELAYKIAVLVYLFNPHGQMLLLKRCRSPNLNLYSPVGGKLEQASGESPFACALREIAEETGQRLTMADIRLLGIVSEKAFEGRGHWLIFCFESLTAVDFPAHEIPEGRLEWVDPAEVTHLRIPQTDRVIIWPLVRQHSLNLNPRGAGSRAEIFSVHIDCSGGCDAFQTTLEQSHSA
jgi:8-oxo-dGTP diphosphatase